MQHVPTLSQGSNCNAATGQFRNITRRLKLVDSLQTRHDLCRWLTSHDVAHRLNRSAPQVQDLMYSLLQL